MKIKVFFQKNKEKFIGALIGVLFGGISATGIIASVWKQITIPWQNKKDIEQLYILVDDKLDKNAFEVYRMDENGKWHSINDKVEVILKYTSD